MVCNDVNININVFLKRTMKDNFNEQMPQFVCTEKDHNDISSKDEKMLKEYYFKGGSVQASCV